MKGLGSWMMNVTTWREQSSAGTACKKLGIRIWDRRVRDLNLALMQSLSLDADVYCSRWSRFACCRLWAVDEVEVTISPSKSSAQSPLEMPRTELEVGGDIASAGSYRFSLLIMQTRSRIITSHKQLSLLGTSSSRRQAPTCPLSKKQNCFVAGL